MPFEPEGAGGRSPAPFTGPGCRTWCREQRRAMGLGRREPKNLHWVNGYGSRSTLMPRPDAMSRPQLRAGAAERSMRRRLGRRDHLPCPIHHTSHTSSSLHSPSSCLVAPSPPTSGVSARPGAMAGDILASSITSSPTYGDPSSWCLDHSRSCSTIPDAERFALSDHCPLSVELVSSSHEATGSHECEGSEGCCDDEPEACG